MAYSLREAAEAVGKGKPAVLKAIKSGRISATRNELGEWQIEPVELHRVYPPVSREPASETGSKEAKETMGNPNGNSLLTQEIQFLRERLTDLERTSDEQRRQLSDQIEDLRHDRDDLRGERDRLLKVIEEQAGSMRLLTDQRAKAEVEAAAASARRGFWPFWRRAG
jgi:chromosome segregation ATPase